MGNGVVKMGRDSINVAITGASSGIGRALALEFAKNHKNITLHLAGRNEAEITRKQRAEFYRTILLHKCYYNALM